MTIKRYGAQRFSGLSTDVGSLPVDNDLLGAIFNSTDTLEFWIFDDTFTWTKQTPGGTPTITSPDGSQGALVMTNDGRMEIIPV